MATIEFENLNKANAVFEGEFKSAFETFLKSGWYILGKEVAQFEKEFADYCQVKHCVGLASGLDALTLGIKSIGVKPGDEIIVAANSYIACILAIVNCDCKPVLVEPNISTYNIDVDKIEPLITNRTKAIMSVHLYGKLCEMAAIEKIAKHYNLQIIEDCAQAHGAAYQNRRAGSFGNCGAFSFYPTKNLGALGDAGALTFQCDASAEKARILRNYGSKKKYFNELQGINSRLDEIQASFLRIKLKALEQINERKRHLASLYFEGLKNDFILPARMPDYYDVYHIFPIRHPDRNALRQYLLNHDIKTEVHYPIPPHRQLALSSILGETEYPITTTIHDTILSLPISMAHSDDEIYRVVDVMNKFQK